MLVVFGIILFSSCSVHAGGEDYLSFFQSAVSVYAGGVDYHKSLGWQVSVHAGGVYYQRVSGRQVNIWPTNLTLITHTFHTLDASSRWTPDVSHIGRQITCLMLMKLL